MAIIPAEEKVFMVSNSTNTTYSGSAALKAMQQWYTMDDVSNTVRPYKVYTALLTQSGGDSPDEADHFPLVVGTTYQIMNNSGGADFTIAGAPNNEVGTHFIATSSIVNWGNAEGSVSWNEGAPVATVLENIIGNIWFTYITTGIYQMVSNNLFLSNKTIGFAGGQGFATFTADPVFNMAQSDTDIIEITTSSGTNEYLNGAPIEIRVYS